jgi:ABC-type Fe3+-hydroxamate transport system substrate-binding protein
MVIGFQVIGSLGLSSGFTPGSEEFRAAAVPGKVMVISGGILILVSILLFSMNMLLTLITPKKEKNLVRSGKMSFKKKFYNSAAFLAAVMLILTIAPFKVSASPQATPEKADVIIIGDRLVDIAYNLGVIPAAMSVRCSLWPMCKTLTSASQVLGCPNCLKKKKAKPLITFAQKHRINKVIIEKGTPFCALVPELHPEDMAGMLRQKGFSVTVVAYSNDLGQTVKQMASLLGKEDKASQLLQTYEKNLAKTMENIEGKTFAKRVVILNGIFQKSSGKSFLRVESPGAYSDKFLLSVLKSTNVGNELVSPDKKPTKGHFTIRKLDSLVAALPDAIIITGDGFAIQKALSCALADNPDLLKVPALRNQAIYNLPGFIQSSLVEYPSILAQWAFVLKR